MSDPLRKLLDESLRIDLGAPMADTPEAVAPRREVGRPGDRPGSRPA